MQTSTCETHCAVLGEFELNPVNDFDGVESWKLPAKSDHAVFSPGSNC